MNTRNSTLAIALAALFGASHAGAAVIGNGLSTSTLGHWSVDVTTGGESRDGYITAIRQDTGAVVQNSEVLYDYFSYVNVGNGGIRLSGSAPTLTAPNQLTSTGSLLGSAGNTINWSVQSSIAAGSQIMSNTFTFSAASGTLGNLSLFQYLDEDVSSPGDDVFFTRGNASAGTLELFTIDNAQSYGISHGGAYSASQGLVNASFAGWAMCNYDSMRPALAAGTQTVSATGTICLGATATTTNPFVGAVRGQFDIVSVLGWNALANATTATFVTTLGGVPDITVVPPANVPEPGSLALVAMGLLGMGAARRRKA